MARDPWRGSGKMEAPCRSPLLVSGNGNVDSVGVCM